MAIVDDYYSSTGAHNIVHDDCYANVAQHEILRRVEYMYEVANDILVSYAQRIASEAQTKCPSVGVLER